MSKSEIELLKEFILSSDSVWDRALNFYYAGERAPSVFKSILEKNKKKLAEMEQTPMEDLVAQCKREYDELFEKEIRKAADVRTPEEYSQLLRLLNKWRPASGVHDITRQFLKFELQDKLRNNGRSKNAITDEQARQFVLQRFESLKERIAYETRMCEHLLAEEKKMAEEKAKLNASLENEMVTTEQDSDQAKATVTTTKLSETEISSDSIWEKFLWENYPKPR